MRIVLSGMVAGDPRQGGATWAVLQYLLGLRELGHRVVLVEPIETTDLAGSPAAAYFRELRPFVGDDAALLDVRRRLTVGTPYERLEQLAAEADLLINVSGMLDDEALIGRIPRRAFLDLDPGFNQVWHQQGHDMGLDAHTHFVTVGLSLGREGCLVPTCGRTWIPTVPPVVLSRWAAAPRPSAPAYTSVGHWRSYGPAKHDGIHYGQRAHSLRELLSLPRRVQPPLRLALGIDPGDGMDIERLTSHGWELVDPLAVAGSPDAYRRFIRDSRAELGVAKSGYVNSRSGWFSERSACYLASARPVVAQDTGFSEHLPVGEGLLAFETVEQAAAAVEEVERDWDRHSEAARELAREVFDSRAVLADLLEALGGGEG